MTRVLVFSASPNKDGLTAACARAAAEGVRLAGGQAEEVRLNDRQVGMCRACDDGRGTCLKERECIVTSALLLFAWGSHLLPVNRRPPWLILLPALTAVMAIVQLSGS